MGQCGGLQRAWESPACSTPGASPEVGGLVQPQSSGSVGLGELGEHTSAPTSSTAPREAKGLMTQRVFS